MAKYEPIKCAYLGCGRVFTPRDKRQRYCCSLCKDREKNRKKSGGKIVNKDLRPQKITCGRTDCLMYRPNMGTHCDGLAIVYEDDMKCAFYKERQ